MSVVAENHQRSVPVLVVALRDHNHFIRTETAIERNPLTISAENEVLSISQIQIEAQKLKQIKLKEESKTHPQTQKV